MSTVLHHGPAALLLLSEQALYQQQLLGLMSQIQVRPDTQKMDTPLKQQKQTKQNKHIYIAALRAGAVPAAAAGADEGDTGGTLTSTCYF
jgi:ribosomal protein L12E/L44/L45/RPP1/RPP2